eukprot:TRINITY_DN2986_c0_g1_i1.p1 TRINITY_DN2986_c0_g1~~TRINITY_DN2986_c0_g1_i1.p1  ORF type:complete len:308 (+),score=69.42 TRINITY_DN2986_c0_g1_i1:36-959(+)
MNTEIESQNEFRNLTNNLLKCYRKSKLRSSIPQKLEELVDYIETHDVSYHENSGSYHKLLGRRIFYPILKLLQINSDISPEFIAQLFVYAYNMDIDDKKYENFRRFLLQIVEEHQNYEDRLVALEIERINRKDYFSARKTAEREIPRLEGRFTELRPPIITQTEVESLPAFSYLHDINLNSLSIPNVFLAIVFSYPLQSHHIVHMLKGVPRSFVDHLLNYSYQNLHLSSGSFRSGLLKWLQAVIDARLVEQLVVPSQYWVPLFCALENDFMKEDQMIESAAGQIDHFITQIDSFAYMEKLNVEYLFS